MIRDQISVEMWETINELYLFLKAPEHRRHLGRRPLRVLPGHQAQLPPLPGADRLDLLRAARAGSSSSSASSIERANKTTRILDVKYHILLPSAADVGGALDTAQWQAVLRSASALEAYRRFYVPRDPAVEGGRVPHLLGLVPALDAFLRRCRSTSSCGGYWGRPGRAPAHRGRPGRRAGCWPTCSP